MTATGGGESTNTVASEQTRPPFDEGAALEALERLREEIRQLRSRRERKVEEFEAWLREVRTASRAERVAALEREATSEPAAAAGARAANRAADSATQSSASTAAAAARATPTSSPFQDDFAAAAPALRSSGRFGGRRVYYAAGAAVIIGAFILARTWGNDTPEPLSSPATSTAPATRQPAEGLPATPKPPAGEQAPAAERRPLQIELTTVRPVWMRVIVDGVRRVEREVPAGQRLNFGADRAIVLRAGDGGGVRLAIDGRDRGPLGRDGQIAVRTLTPADKR